MTYTIEIAGMEFRARHGCYEVEQLVGGNFTVDISLTVNDLDDAAAKDDIEKTVNYVLVYETVEAQMAIPSKIIENVAHRIVKAVRARFPQVEQATVTVAKLAPPIGGKAERVAVTVRAGRANNEER